MSARPETYTDSQGREYEDNEARAENEDRRAAERTVVRCSECATLQYGERHKLHSDFAGPVWMDVIEEHTPDYGTDQSDSVWITCTCGWDSSERKALGWFEHLLAAVSAKAPE